MNGTSFLHSVNPYTGEWFSELPVMTCVDIESALQQADSAARHWRSTPCAARAATLRAAADILRRRSREYAALITQEMGKLFTEAEAEVKKCAWVCDYYAEHGAAFLADESVSSDARRSFITCQPLGPVLAVMPWNFPFWQVFRFAAPALMAGNVALLKHASNVSLCAKAIEEVFALAGAPAGVFTTLLLHASQVVEIIEDPRVKAVSLTGSEPAGKAVAACAAGVLKKSLLELGGSDAFIVLEDADLELAASKAVASRFNNAGQSCIAAKRFLVQDAIADEFVLALHEAVLQLRPGDPMDARTTLAPMARADLRDELQQQVQDALDKGAEPVAGCHPVIDTETFYAASILDRITPEMRVWSEELFGPVASIIRVADEDSAIRIANDSRFGLGGSVWTRDLERGERLARQLECGCAFVNEMVKSDPRLPFGGIKASGYGRELARHGMLEFVNVKTLWID